MRTGWQHRPDNWPAAVQIGLALLCIVPPAVLITVQQNTLALCAVVAGLGFWCWLGRNTRGFPLLLFDLTVYSQDFASDFLISIAAI
jgi:hypothetical protein